MNLLEQVKEKFSNEINKVFWEKNEDGRFLKIELKEHKFDKVEQISKEINEFLDTFEESSYILDIYSMGIDLKISHEDLNNFIDKKIELKLEKPYLEEYQIIIKLLEVRPEGLYGIKNNKGRMQKITVLKENILEINKVLENK